MVLGGLEIMNKQELSEAPQISFLMNELGLKKEGLACVPRPDFSLITEPLFWRTASA